MDIVFAHIDDAFQPKHGADRRARHAVLTRARLGDDAPLAHALRQQALPQRVVDLVRAGMRQVFALEVDLYTRCDQRREARHIMQRGGTPDKAAQL